MFQGKKRISRNKGRQSKMNEADVFLQALQGGDSTSGDPFVLFGSGLNSSSDVNKLPESLEHSEGISPKDRGSSNQFEPMSLTPESYHSFYEDPNGASVSLHLQQQQQHQQHQQPSQQQLQQQQQQQQDFSRNSLFELNGFEKPQQQSQNDSFVLGKPNNGYVKSEFSPRISSGTDDNKSNNAAPGSVDGDGEGDIEGDGDGNDESEDLVKDEFGFNLEEVPSTEEFSRITTKSGKVIKKRKEKTSHNVIEKKYRTNINDKIFQLRAIVPALRVAYKRHAGIPVVSKDLADLDGLQPARKLNKASILMKTIEYITYLENKCENYLNQNKLLRNNVPTPQSSRSQSLPQQQHQQQQQQQQQQQSAVGGGFGHFSSPMYSTIPTTSSTVNGVSAGGTATAPTTTSSAHDFQSSSEFDPHSVEEDDAGGDFTSKLLMGCFGVSMGAQAFGGDGGEMGSARALFAMPVFHFSPTTGFAISNSNGVVNLRTSIFALFKIILVLATFVHLARCLFFSTNGKSKKKSENGDIISTVPYKDTVAFHSEDHLKETLKKTLVLNKLKYKHNSMERIESNIAKCFGLVLYFRNSNLPWSYFGRKYVQNKWQEIRDQVVKANRKSQGTLSSGLEWEMITNVSTGELNLTLSNERLLNHLSSEHHEYELKEFLSLVNAFILDDTKEFLLGEFLDQVTSSGTTDTDARQQIAIKFCDSHVSESKLLHSIPEEYEVINCLIRPTKTACERLLKLVKMNNESPSAHSLEEQLVLYSSVMRYFITNKRFSQCITWLQNKPLCHLNRLGSGDLSLVSFTALFLMINDIMENLEFFKGEVAVLESLCKELRIWLGRGSGNALGFEVRSRLIDYCIDQALVCGSLANENTIDVTSDLESEVSWDEQEQLGEINDKDGVVLC